MRVFIVDDEQHCLDELTWRLRKYPDLEIAGAYTDPNAALAAAGESSPDAAFMDIDIPRLDGLELALRMQAQCPGLIVIFVTAHAQYALDAFRAFPLDFLLKPVKEARLEETVAHLRAQHALLHPAAASDRRVKLRCFGPFALHAAGEVRWETRRVRELLQFLIDLRGAAPSKDEMLRSIFEAEADKKALNNLYMTVYRLRSLLSSLDAEGRYLRLGGDYSLTVAPDVCDYSDFMDFAGRAPVISEKNAAGAARALNLCKGQYLEGECREWALETRREVEAQYERIALGVAGCHAAAGRVPEAEGALNALLARNPLSTDGYTALLDLYMEGGSRAAYCQRYEQYARMLRYELRVKPLAKYKEHFDRVRRMK